MFICYTRKVAHVTSELPHHPTAMATMSDRRLLRRRRRSLHPVVRYHVTCRRCTTRPTSPRRSMAEVSPPASPGKLLSHRAYICCSWCCDSLFRSVVVTHYHDIVTTYHNRKLLSCCSYMCLLVYDWLIAHAACICQWPGLPEVLSLTCHIHTWINTTWVSRAAYL